MNRRIKVLLVDDSAVVREVLTAELSREPEIEIIGTAPDAFIARDKILKYEPDVVLLDIEMPRLDGLSFLRRLMHYHPLPVIIVSSLTPPGGEMALEAVTAGAVDVVCKPGPGLPLSEMTEMLIAKIRAAAQSNCRRVTPVVESDAKLLTAVNCSRQLIAIGASTGGTQAIEKILQQFPASAPATLIVQHMPAYFTASFAARLNKICAMEVREAVNGEAIEPGQALVAPGNRHMLLRCVNNKFFIQLKDGPVIHHQRPSIEAFFQSLAQCAAPQTAAALLTGMGRDGANGLLALRKAGAYTIAQDEATSVVFGMPAEAIRLGAAQEIVALPDIAGKLLAGSAV